MPERRLYRSRKNRVLFGVCAGLGAYFLIDPTVVRIGFIVAAILFPGPWIPLVYLGLFFLVPQEPEI